MREIELAQIKKGRRMRPFLILDLFKFTEV